MPKIIIYSTIACGYWMRAKQLLKEKQIPFEEIDVSYSPDGRRTMMEKAGGRMTVPQIFIGDTHVGGWQELYELERSGRLVPLLSAA
jgi:glutaredoxin 3